MNKILTIAALLLSVKAMALTEQQKSYAMFCGSRADLVEMAKAEGQKLSSKDLLELNKSRKPILDVLKTGDKGIQKLLSEGSAAGTGPFGAIMACGIIVQLKKEIIQEGCYDLRSNTLVKDNGGIKACSELLKKLPR